MYLDEYAIEQPDNFTLEQVEEIAIESTKNFRLEQIEIWGDYNGIKISRDMVRQVLMVLEKLPQNNM